MSKYIRKKRMGQDLFETTIIAATLGLFLCAFFSNASVELKKTYGIIMDEFSDSRTYSQQASSTST